MLPKFMRHFKVECQQGKQLNQRRMPSSSDGGGQVSSTESTGMDVGLRLLTQVTNTKGKSNVLVKSAIRKVNQTSTLDSCFLKTCNLCNKYLSPDKDIYMYRGDQGYCSAECRNRQIVLDEMKELENSTKEMVPSYRHCSNDASRETRLILDDLRRQRLKSKQNTCNQNHWAIVSWLKSNHS